MGKLFALGCFVLLVGCADGGDPFPDGGAPSQGGSPAEGGSSEGGGGAGPVCGDDIIDEGEECDGENLGENDCLSLDFVGGELSCTSKCKLNKTECLVTLCGNGLVDNGEECEGEDVGALTCIGAGFAGGTLTCDADACLVDASGCREAFAEDFEDDDTPAALLTGNWYVDPDMFHGGLRSIRANDIADGATTAMALPLAFDVPGSISFWHREQTESCCDLLYFYIDDELKMIASSDTWQMSTFNVPVGFHTFEWRFNKDLATSTGADTVWVDDIVATAGYLD